MYNLRKHYIYRLHAVFFVSCSSSAVSVKNQSNDKDFDLEHSDNFIAIISS